MAFNLTKIPEKLLKACDPNKSAGTTLMVINALSMVFAAASDTFAAAVDKNTSAEDKKFLIPAGVATGVAKIGIYFAMTKKIIEKLEKTAVKFVEKMDSDVLQKNAFALVSKKIAKEKKADIKQAMEELLLNTDKKSVTEKGIELYKSNSKAAASVLGAFTGAVVGCAILTPILRDVTAYFVQKRMEKNNPKLKEEPYKPYNELVKMGYAYNNQPINMRSYMSYTSNGKIRV